jgi:signal transduction histidine kinase
MRAEEKQRLLTQASQTLTATLEVPQVIDRLLKAAVEITDAGGSLAWLWDEERTGGLVCRAAFLDGESLGPCDLRLLPGQGIAGWVAQSGRSDLIARAPDDARFSPGVDEKTGFHTTSVLAVPLKMRDHIHGVLEVKNKRQGSFDANDRFLVEMLAASATIAIDNARLVEALRRYAVELEARNQDLDAFSHTAAHDLKNPLARIIGFAELLEVSSHKLTEEEVQRCLDTIARNARRMNNIVDELLLLAGVRKVETVQLAPLDMAHIVDEALQRLADLIEGHQAEIITPPAEAWPTAQGYGPWIEEVWVNYLSNAILYGGQPPRVELGATTEADGSIRFWVRDNGNGLTSEEQARLFTPFTRLEQIRVKGHGLGLSIVRRIVEKLGGQVGVESQVGEGSVFSFTLPAATR